MCEPNRTPPSPGVSLRCLPRSRPDLIERSEEHTSELQSQSNLVCRLLLEKKKLYDDRLHQRRNNCRPLVQFRVIDHDDAPPTAVGAGHEVASDSPHPVVRADFDERMFIVT